MAILDDLKTVATGALSAGAAESRTQGAALKDDFEKLVKPDLDSIVARIARITQNRISNRIDDDQAREDLTAQLSNVAPVIMAEAELAQLAVQTIINAVLDALKAGVNKAIGIALL